MTFSSGTTEIAEAATSADSVCHDSTHANQVRQSGVGYSVFCIVSASGSIPLRFMTQDVKSYSEASRPRTLKYATAIQRTRLSISSPYADVRLSGCGKAVYGPVVLQVYCSYYVIRNRIGEFCLNSKIFSYFEDSGNGKLSPIVGLAGQPALPALENVF